MRAGTRTARRDRLILDEQIGRTMVRQMLFMDPPVHTSLRGICSVAFTPHRVESLRRHIQAIVDSLLETHLAVSRIELMGRFREPSACDCDGRNARSAYIGYEKLKAWSAQFAEIFSVTCSTTPIALPETLQSLEEMSNYFQTAIREQRQHPGSGLIAASITAHLDGQHLSEESIIANCIILAVGRAGDNSQPDW